MAKIEENSNPDNQVNLGSDLSVIRNILFGQQAAEFDTNFKALNKRFDKNEADFLERYQKLESLMRARIDEMEKNILTRVRELESHVDTTAGELHGKIIQTSNADKAAIGQMLIEIGNRLIGNP